MSAAVDAKEESATRKLQVTLDLCLNFYVTNNTPHTSFEGHKGTALTANYNSILRKMAMKGGHIESTGKCDMQTADQGSEFDITQNIKRC
jgi:hypothetical protein